MRYIATAICIALSLSIAFTCGIVIPPTPEGQFSIRYRHMEATIKDGVVQVTAEQTFANETKRTLEGIYLFPAPEGAAVNRLMLTIDDKSYEAELLSREEAVRTYEHIVGIRRDPALLEFINRRTFRLRIFPFPPNGERKVSVRYDQLLRKQGNTYRFVYPLKVERLSAKPIKDARITIRISSRQPIKTIYSPTHPISVRRPDEYTATVTYEARDVREPDDFVLYYSVSEGEFGVMLLPYRSRTDRDGYFLLFISPQISWEKPKLIPKDIAFIIDRSGSMSGNKIEQAKEALKFCVERLNDDDRFNIAAFNESPDLLWRELRQASEANKREAIKFVEALNAQGGTNINEALLTALPMLSDRSRQRFIIFLTDGLPTVGETNTERILANAKKANETNVRLFAFGVGYDVNALFLDRLANDNSGASVYVRPQENIESKVSDLFMMVSEPVLSDVKVGFDGVRVRDIYPQRIPDLFKGTEVVLAGAYTDGGKATIKITGRIGEREQSYSFVVDFPKRDTQSEFVPRIWAARKIGYLLEEITMRGSNKELIDEIVRLSKDFGVLTEFTAFLVTEPTVPIVALRERVRSELEEASRRAEVGAWAIAQAMNRQILQRAASNYDLVIGSQAPLRTADASVTLRYSLAAAPNASFGLTGVGGQILADRKGEVRIISNMQVVADRAFAQSGKQWVDMRYDLQRHKLIRIKQFSKAVIQLLQINPELAKFISLGDEVIFVANDDLAIQVGAEGKEELSEAELQMLKRAAAPLTQSELHSHIAKMISPAAWFLPVVAAFGVMACRAGNLHRRA